MPDLNHEQIARAVADGKHVYDADKAIGWLLVLGLICFPVAPQSAFLGIPLLILVIWSRNISLKGQ